MHLEPLTHSLIRAGFCRRLTSFKSKLLCVTDRVFIVDMLEEQGGGDSLGLEHETDCNLEVRAIAHLLAQLLYTWQSSTLREVRKTARIVRTNIDQPDGATICKSCQCV
jgi:hypothetical protein